MTLTEIHYDLRDNYDCSIESIIDFLPITNYFMHLRCVFYYETSLGGIDVDAHLII